MAPLSARALGGGAATGGRPPAVRAAARAAFGGGRATPPPPPGLAAPRADGCSSSSALACVAPGPDDYSFATVEPRPTGRRNRGFDKKEGAPPPLFAAAFAPLSRLLPRALSCCLESRAAAAVLRVRAQLRCARRHCCGGTR